jgi:hypothetical protein
MRSGTGRGRQGPGLLGATGRPAVLPGTPAPVSGRASAGAPAAGGDRGTAGAPPRSEVLPHQEPAEGRPGRRLPRHQPWNAASVPLASSGPSIDELSARLHELDELQRAGLLTEEEFARQRAWLLAT